MDIYKLEKEYNEVKFHGKSFLTADEDYWRAVVNSFIKDSVRSQTSVDIEKYMELRTILFYEAVDSCDILFHEAVDSCESCENGAGMRHVEMLNCLLTLDTAVHNMVMDKYEHWKSFTENYKELTDKLFNLEDDKVYPAAVAINSKALELNIALPAQALADKLFYAEQYEKECGECSGSTFANVRRDYITLRDLKELQEKSIFGVVQETPCIVVYKSFFNGDENDLENDKELRADYLIRVQFGSHYNSIRQKRHVKREYLERALQKAEKYENGVYGLLPEAMKKLRGYATNGNECAKN